MRRMMVSWAALLALAVVMGCDASGDGTTDPGVGPDAADVTDPGTPPGDEGQDPGREVPGDVADPGPGDPGPGDPAPGDQATDAPPADLPPGDEGRDTTPPPATPWMLIATQDSLKPAAEDWAAYRRTRGFEVEVVTATEVAGTSPVLSDVRDGLRSRLRAARDARGEGARLFLLLLGDAPANGVVQAARLPAHTCENTTPGTTGCWTDNTFGDLDGDDVPDVAVGRVPARNDTEARAVLAKVQDFESTYRTGLFNRRLGLYVGEAGFGEQIDSLLEYAMMEGLKLVSHAFDIVGAWDSPTSSYWYIPFTDKVVDLFNEGALALIYIGHGSEEWTQGLTTDEVAAIDCSGTRRPFAFFFACYAGNFASSHDSLGETLAFKGDGPVASFGSSDVSHPYGNAILAYETQRVLLEMRYETLGEVVNGIKRATMDNQDDFRDLIDGGASLDTSCDTPLKQATIRRQHLDLYNLLGDPGTAMQYPRDLATLQVQSGTVASGSLKVAGTAPGVEDGEAYVTLETERDVVLQPLATIDPGDPDAADVNANWAKSNDKVVKGATVTVTGGAFSATLDFATDLPGGDYYLKVYAHDPADDVIGVLDAP